MPTKKKRAISIAKADALGSVELFASRVREDIDSQAIIIMFGSYAKKITHAKSDIDIAIISSAFGIDKAANCGILGKIIYEVNASIESHTFSVDEWSFSSPFIEEIKRTGVIL